MIEREWWVLEAKETCHDVLWFNAERDDIRTMPKHDALKIIQRNPGKFAHVDTWIYKEGEWLKNASGSLRP